MVSCDTVALYYVLPDLAEMLQGSLKLVLVRTDFSQLKMNTAPQGVEEAAEIAYIQFQQQVRGASSNVDHAWLFTC